MPNKPVLAAVSYINTKPFIYGMEMQHASNYVSIELHNPAALANVLKLGGAQIGLVPVAALPTLTGFKQFGEYGIGSLGTVASVCAFSYKPMHECKYVLLDYQSKTSVALIQVLLKNYWHINIPFVQAEPGYETHIPEDAIAVIIGDRALEARTHYKYIYDLAEAWNHFTGLPFVFAVWVAHASVSDTILNKLNEAFAFGVAHINESIKHYDIHLTQYDIKYYLNNNIYYRIEDEQRKAQSLFLQYCSQTIPAL